MMTSPWPPSSEPLTTLGPGTRHCPPVPSAYLQSWLVRGDKEKPGEAEASSLNSSTEVLERELAELTGEEAPKTASKDLLGRTLPRLAAHGVPGRDTLSSFVGLLADGATAERYAMRYAYYFIQRIAEHYGWDGLGRGEAGKAIETLSSECRERTGARQILATRVLFAAARAGVFGAAEALDAGTCSALQQLSMGKVPNSGKKKSSIFSSGGGGGTDSATRAAMGARRRMMTAGAWRQQGGGGSAVDINDNNNGGGGAERNAGGGNVDATSGGSTSSVVPPASALATAVASTDAIAARHALSIALAAAQGPDFESLARVLEPGLAAAARDLEAGHAALAAAEAAAVAAAATNDSDKKAATATADKAAAAALKPRPRDKEAPNTDDPAAQALLARLCGVLRSRLLSAEAGTTGHGQQGHGPPLRTVLAAAAAMAAAEAPPGAGGASARAAAWAALCGGGGGGGGGNGGEEPDALTVVTSRLAEVLLGGDGDGAAAGDAAKAAACRAAAALGEARAAARAAGHPSTSNLAASSGGGGGGSVGEAKALPRLASALVEVAEDNSLGGGVRVEALRALLWLQTPTFLPDVLDTLTRQLCGQVSGRREWELREFNYGELQAGAFVDPTSTLSPSSSSGGGEGSLGGAWRGCDAPQRLLAAITARCGLAASSTAQTAQEAAAWLKLTLDATLAVVAAAPRSAPPTAVLAVLCEAQQRGAQESLLAATTRLATAARMSSGSGSGTGPLESALLWHLGENANYNASEYSWTAEVGATLAAVVAPRRGGAFAAAARNPPLAAAVASLQRALLTSCDWSVRAAAVHALATVAVRSGEPFRLQCYAALRAVQRADADGAAADEANAVAAANPAPLAFEVNVAVTVLDHIYRGQERVAALVGALGVAPEAWGAGPLAEVAGRHAVLVELTSRMCFVPRRMYAPLGSASMPYVEAFADARLGDVAVAAATAAKLMGEEAAATAEERRKRSAGVGMPAGAREWAAAGAGAGAEAPDQPQRQQQQTLDLI